MVVVRTLPLLYLSSSLCLLYFFFAFIKFLHKVWWTPIRVQHVLRQQGIKGPAYRSIHGNTKEVSRIWMEAMTRPTGLSHHTLPRILPHIHCWIKTYGRNFVYWAGQRAEFVVTDSEFVKEILTNKDRIYSKPPQENYIHKLLGDGLFSTEGEKWSKLRKLANHSFNADSLKSMSPAVVASVEMMLERWKHHEGKEINVSEEFRLLTSEVISRTAFGSSYLEGKDIFDKLMQLIIVAVRNFHTTTIPGLSKFLKSSDEIESDKLEQGIKDSIVEIMKKREKAMTGEVDNWGSDFLGLLLKANHDDGSDRITIEDVVDECKTFYIAGHETTTSLLSWAVLLLSIHTDWQEMAREEVLKLFGQQQYPNSEGISRLKKMNMIIHESLRLYPPVSAITREVKKESKLGELNLPENTKLLIPVLALHQDNLIWGEDAHLFNPERFSNGVAKATNNNQGAFLPFGLGPRTCVGLNFATNEVKIALSMILQRYSFTLSPAYTHSPVQMLTVAPQHGVQVILSPL